MKKITSSITSIFSSVLVVLGLATCCGTPILAAIVSFLGIGTSQISFLSEYQPLFLFIAVISLLIGFYQVYFKKPSNCCSTEKTSCNTEIKKEEKTKNSFYFHKIMLWIAAIIVSFMLFKTKAISNNSQEKQSCPSNEKEEVIKCCTGKQ